MGNIFTNVILDKFNISSYESLQCTKMYFRRFSSGHKTLWDETEINNVLQEYVNHHFPQSYQRLFDTVEEMCNISDTSPRENKSTTPLHNRILDICSNSTQKSVALLYSTWKIDSGELVDLLLSKGADPNFSDPDGRSCLHLSCCAGHPNNVERLLSKGYSKLGKEKSGTEQK